MYIYREMEGQIKQEDKSICKMVKLAAKYCPISTPIVVNTQIDIDRYKIDRKINMYLEGLVNAQIDG